MEPPRGRKYPGSIPVRMFPPPHVGEKIRMKEAGGEISEDKT